MSPFFLGPCPLYGGIVAQNVENAWQFSKVYSSLYGVPHVDQNGLPNQNYWKWAMDGFKDTKAYRYPAGKGAKPLYAWWDGKPLGYIEARKQIYIPVYFNAVATTPAFAELRRKLKQTTEDGKDLWLWDFDGYNHKALGMSYADVANNASRSMGHAFVLGMMLEMTDIGDKL